MVTLLTSDPTFEAGEEDCASTSEPYYNRHYFSRAIYCTGCHSV